MSEGSSFYQFIAHELDLDRHAQSAISHLSYMIRNYSNVRTGSPTIAKTTSLILHAVRLYERQPPTLRTVGHPSGKSRKCQHDGLLH